MRLAPRPTVHLTTPFLAGGAGWPSQVVNVPLCRRRGPETSLAIGFTTEPEAVTCNACREELAKRVETQLRGGDEIVHLMVHAGEVQPFACPAYRGATNTVSWSRHPGVVTCPQCIKVSNADAFLANST